MVSFLPLTPAEVTGLEPVAETVERVGLDVLDGEAVRWTGFLATGGGAFFDVEEVVEVESLRSVENVRGGDFAVVRDKPDFESAFRRAGRESVTSACAKDFVKAETFDAGLNGGGSLRIAFAAPDVEGRGPFDAFPVGGRGFGGGGAKERVLRSF